MILDPAKTHRIGLRTGTRRSHWAARFQFSPCGHRSRILPPGGLRPERHPNRAAPPRVGVFLPNGQAIAVVLVRVLPHGSREEVTAHVRDLIETVGQHGGYIVASDHSLNHHIPIDNIWAIRDAVRQYGLYGKTKR
jgi:hypothetical protein